MYSGAYFRSTNNRKIMCEQNPHANCEAFARRMGARCLLYQRMTQEALDVLKAVVVMLEAGDDSLIIECYIQEFAQRYHEKLKKLPPLEVPDEMVSQEP